jgi:hypothetical protein
MSAAPAANVWMIRRGEDLAFPFEAREAVRIAREGVRQDFERDVPTKLRITRPIDLAHPAGAEQR